MENKNNKRKDQPSSASTNHHHHHHRHRNVKPKLAAVTPPNPEPQDQEIRELQTLSLFPTEPSPSSNHSQDPEFSSPPPARAVTDDLNTVITPPFPWATDRPAKIHTLQYLNQNKILTINGDVQCGSCGKRFEMEFDLNKKAAEHQKFLKDHRASLHNRGPKEWRNPNPIACKFCGQEKSVKPVIGNRKEHSINWLFLWLGQFIGFCNLEDLRYFCKYNKLHRTAAKDRFVFNVYNEIFKQLIQAN